MTLKLGNKHICPSCGTKFYDLGNSKPVCPGCGTENREQDPEAKPSRPRKTKVESKSAEPDLEVGGGDLETEDDLDDLGDDDGDGDGDDL